MRAATRLRPFIVSSSPAHSLDSPTYDSTTLLVSPPSTTTLWTDLGMATTTYRLEDGAVDLLPE